MADDRPSVSRLVLRRPQASDTARLFAIFGDPRTNQFNPSGPYVDISVAEESLAAWAEHWDRHGFGQWAVSTVAAPDEVIGFGGLAWKLYDETERLNLGYRFAHEAWGHGYATELGRLALGHAFGALNGDEVFGLVRPANTASIHVLEKLGMNRFGDLDDVPGEARSLVYSIRNPALLAA